MSTLNLLIRPEFFRLPVRGVDPHFGLSRAFYYQLDATGQVLLVRLRKRGSLKGVTLVNYDAMSAFLAGAADGSRGAKEPEPPPTVAPPAAGNAYRIVHRFPEEMELMRKLTPSLMHNLLSTIHDLEQMLQAASHGT
jgi:hypothetical protein